MIKYTIRHSEAIIVSMNFLGISTVPPHSEHIVNHSPTASASDSLVLASFVKMSGYKVSTNHLQQKDGAGCYFFFAHGQKFLAEPSSNLYRI